MSRELDALRAKLDALTCDCCAADHPKQNAEWHEYNGTLYPCTAKGAEILALLAENGHESVASPQQDSQDELRALPGKWREWARTNEYTCSENIRTRELADELDAVLAQPQKQNAECAAPRGTMRCPICEDDFPHSHGEQDVFDWLKAQASRFGYNVAISKSALCELGNEEPCYHTEDVQRGMKLAGMLQSVQSLHRMAAIIGVYLRDGWEAELDKPQTGHGEERK